MRDDLQSRDHTGSLSEEFHEDNVPLLVIPIHTIIGEAIVRLSVFVQVNPNGRDIH